MKGLFNYLFIFTMLLSIASCNSQEGGEVDTSKLSVTPGAFEITILSPSEDGHSLSGYSVISGECGKPGFPIEISGPVNLYSICQDNYQWAAPVSGVEASVGDVTYSVTLRERNMTAGSSTVNRTFVKVDNDCLDQANKSKLFANFGAGGDGASTPYKICTPEQLSNIRFFPSAKFQLASDINFLNAIVKPIAVPFSGELDGRGFTMENLLIKDLGGTEVAVGLFKAVNSGAIVKNLFIKDVIVEGYQRVGVLAGDWRGLGTIDNVKVQGSVTGTTYIGGLIGLGNSTSALSISNVKTNINVTGNNYVAGLISYVNTTGGLLSVTNSELQGNISGDQYVGGVIGRSLEANITMDSVSHKGTIQANLDMVGGIAGEIPGGSFSNISKVGAIIAPLDAVDVNVGGLIGFAKGTTTISNSNVVSDITTGGHYVGGLVGKYVGGSILNSYTRGTITVNDDKYNSVTKFVGGLVGNVSTDSSISSSHSLMNITTNAQYVGGLVGYFNGLNSSISNSYSNGVIAAKTSFVGGLVGQFNGNSISNSFSRSNISITNPTPNTHVGGISGYVNSPAATFSKLYNSGSITINDGIADKVGGLFGYVNATGIEHSFNAGNISGTRSQVGGIAGYLRASLFSAYSSGDIDSSFRYVGGIAGLVNNKNISDVFFSGEIRGSGEVGGIVGAQFTSGATISNAYVVGNIRKQTTSAYDDSIFGPIYGVSDDPNTVSNAYFKDVMELTNLVDSSILTHNGSGQALSDGQLRNSTYFTGYNFATDWLEAPDLFRLPFSSSDYLYPVLSFMTETNYGFQLPESYSDDPMAEPIASLFLNEQNLIMELSPEEISLVQSTVPVHTVNVGSLELTVLSPKDNTDPISKTKLIYGECGQAGNPIQITGDFNLWTICQTNNRWAAMVDASSLPVGNITINVRLLAQDLSASSTTITRVMTKATDLCSDNQAIDGTFANSHLGADGDAVPFKLCHSGHFQNIAYYPNKKFELANDIDFSGNHISPIASTFTGSLDGKGFTIKNYIINKSSRLNAGLFSIVNNATFKNIKLDNFAVNGYDRSGALAGTWAGTGSLTNIIAKGSVTGIVYTGGLIGVATGANITISDLDTTITVTGNNHTGGVIAHVATDGGLVNASNITLANTVSGLSSVGGFIGSSLEPNMTFNNISQSGDVSSYKEYLGGLFGDVKSVTLQNCNITGNITSTKYAEDGFVGGAIGRASVSASLDSCQFSGVVTGGANFVGGLIGSMESGSLNNVQTSGTLNVVDQKYNSVLSFSGGLVGKINENSTMNSSSSNMTLNVQSQFTGGLVGRFDGEESVVTNSYFTGVVNARTAYVGGIIGLFNGVRLEDSYSTGAVNISNATPNANIGGLLGYANRPTSAYKNLYATGNVTILSGLADYVGGLVGYFRGGTLSDSYATGNVTGGRSSIGGLVGLHRGLTQNSFATGSVDGSFRFVGGLIGYLYLGSINESMALGNVVAKAQSGGLVGYANSTTNSISSSYAFNTVQRAAGSSEDESLFGPVAGVLEINDIVDSSVYYLNENIQVNHNTIGAAIAQSLASSSSSFIGFDFSSSPGWRMPAASYVLPGVSGDYTYPIPEFISSSTAIPMYKVSGTVEGLNHSSVRLSLNGAEEIEITSNDTSFEFTTNLASGSTFEVLVTSNTTAPSIECVLTNKSGTIGNQDVSNVSLSCPTVDALEVLYSNSNMALSSTLQVTARGTLSTGQFIDLTDYVDYSFQTVGVISASTTGLLTADTVGSTRLTVSYGQVSSFVDMNVFTAPESSTAVAWVESTPHNEPNATASWTLSTSNIVSQKINLYTDASCSSAAIQSIDLTNSESSYQFSSLLDGQTYYFSVSVFDNNNLEAVSSCSSGLAISIPTPDPVSSLASAKVWINGTLPVVSPLITWVNSTGVTDVKMALGSSSGGTEAVDWTSIGNVTSHTFTNLSSLVECSAYFPSVKVTNEWGVESSVATDTLGFRWDNTPPLDNGELVLSSNATSSSSPIVSWSAASDNCAMRWYEMAIGTTPGGTDVSDYKFIGNVQSFQAVNGGNGFILNLSEATNYYTTVRAVDYAGNKSSGITSSAWQIQSLASTLPEMIVWLDAADKTSIIDRNGFDATSASFNGEVQTWGDVSGSLNPHNFYSESVSNDVVYNGEQNAFEFDGNSSYLVVDNHTELNLSTMTQKNVTVSLKTGLDINNRQVIYEEGGSNSGMNIYIADGKVYCGFWTNDGGDGAQDFTSVSSNILANSVYHVTWNFDYSNYVSPTGADGKLECFINGQSIGETPVTSRIFSHNDLIALGAGRDGSLFHDGSLKFDGHYFNGTIYEFLITNQAPSLEDITSIHNYLMGKWSGDILYSPSSLVLQNNAELHRSATLSWTPVAGSFNVDHYEFSIGTSQGGTEVLYWTNIGNVTSYQAQNGIDGISLELQSGIDYYLGIKAIDNFGNESVVATSNAWQLIDMSNGLANMIFWHDSSDLTTILDASGISADDPLYTNPVKTWSDKSGSVNNHDFTTFNNPTYDFANSSVVFNGSNTKMFINSHSDIDSSTYTEKSVTVAFKTSTDVTSRQVIYEQGDFNRGMNIYIDSGKLYCAFWNLKNDGDGIQTFIGLNTPVGANEYKYVTWLFDYRNYTGATGEDGKVECIVNQASIGSGNTTSRMFPHVNGIGLGGVESKTVYHDGGKGNGDSFLGEIFEVMMTSDVPQETTIHQFHHHLQNKWQP